MMSLSFAVLMFMGLLGVPKQPVDCVLPQKQGIRFATFNSSLNRKSAGELTTELKSGQSQAADKIAEVIGWVQPDVLLLQELDKGQDQENLEIFYQDYLRPYLTLKSSRLPYRYHFESNTGVPTAFDLDRDQKLHGPGDAQGFGTHAGQYGFAILSKLPFDAQAIHSFQKLLWKAKHRHNLDQIKTGKQDWYSQKSQEVLRLSSKNHVMVPLSFGQTEIWIIGSHPTPPVFDGAEDRNGWRNYDEIGLVKQLIDGKPTVTSDRGQQVGLKASSNFVIMGDLNADPSRGDGRPGAIQQLLDHPRVQPSTANGNAVPAAMGVDEKTRFDTASFGLRVDYVLPSKTMNIHANGICRAPLIGGKPVTDHHLVWVDASPSK